MTWRRNYKFILFNTIIIDRTNNINQNYEILEEWLEIIIFSLYILMEYTYTVKSNKKRKLYDENIPDEDKILFEDYSLPKTNIKYNGKRKN